MSAQEPVVVRTGTGDGGVLQSRKMWAFLFMVIAVLVLLLLTTKVGTPENVTIQALWAICFGAYVLMGAQGVIDLVMRSKWGAPVAGESKTVTEKSSTVVVEKGTGT